MNYPSDEAPQFEAVLPMPASIEEVIARYEEEQHPTDEADEWS